MLAALRREDSLPLLEINKNEEPRKENRAKTTKFRSFAYTKSQIIIGVIVFIFFLHSLLSIYYYFGPKKEPSIESLVRLGQTKNLTTTVFETNRDRFLGSECFLTNPTAEDVIRENSHLLPSTQPINKHKLCQAEDAENCAIPLKPVRQHYFVIEKLKSLVCPIPKNFSTVLTAIVCLLNDVKNVLAMDKSLLDRALVNGECTKKEVQSWEEAVNTYQITEEDLSPMTIVREPIDRFLSGYMYTCLRGMQYKTGCTRHCFGCGQNLTCYLEQLHERVLIASKSGSPIIDASEIHMIPQNWFCDFHSHLSAYKLLRYHSDPLKMFEQLDEYFETKNVSAQALRFIKKSITKHRTKHSTVDMDYRKFLENRIKQSPYLMNLIKRIYFHDYRLFDFEMDD